MAQVWERRRAEEEKEAKCGRYAADHPQPTTFPTRP